MGGIGSAICKVLAEDGYTVVANYAIPGSETKWLEGMRLIGYADLAHVAYGDVSDFDAMGKMISMIEGVRRPSGAALRCHISRQKKPPVARGFNLYPKGTLR